MFTLDPLALPIRKGKVVTPHGELTTPFFMPDATRASVRGLSTRALVKVDIEALVVNTYHLFLQPGETLIRESGGIHRFMHWTHPVLSDSGGYQVFSLIHKHPELGKITEEGAEFRSVIDGSKHLLTPERSIQIQFDLGVDMLVCLDDPRPNDVGELEMRESVERTIRWAKRCREEYARQVANRGLLKHNQPLIFGVVQGGMIPELRTQCADQLAELDFDGYGFGGRHVDSEGNFLEDILRVTAAAIPQDKLRFALGIGTPSDIIQAYGLGWDMFDCVIPTREGRHGRLFVWNQSDELRMSNNDLRMNHSNFIHHSQSALQPSFYTTINIRNEEFKENFSQVDPTCDCTLCTDYTPSYLHHLFRVEEPLALFLASEHNLRFYMRLMQTLRQGL